MIIALHILGITFETVLGVWIFSKAFPERETWGWKQTANELIMDMLLLYIILLNFAKNFCFAWKLFIAVLIIGTLLAVRIFLKKADLTGAKNLNRIRCVIKYIEFTGIIGILVWNHWLAYTSLMMAITGNIFLPFFLYCYYRCSWFQAYIWQLIYLPAIQIAKVTYMTYVRSGKSEELASLFQRMHSLSAVLFELGICVVILLVVKYFSAHNVLKRALNECKAKAVTTAILEAALLVCITEMGLDGFDEEDSFFVFLIMIIVFLTFLIFIVNAFKRSLEMEKRLVDVRNEAVEQQYRELRTAYERNRCIVHDEKHMIQYIEECLKNGEVEAALQFVGNYKRNVQDSLHYAWTGIPTLDFIINTKKEEMDALSIDFAVNMQADEIPIEDADFVVLLGNLLDNAIEAAQKCPIGNREINLKMRIVNNMFLLWIKNSSMVLPDRKSNRFVTSKEKTEGHGWGIESIKHIVKKYDGDIDFIYDQKSFQVKILIDIESMQPTAPRSRNVIKPDK